MNTNETPKRKTDEVGLLTTLAIIVLLILPMLGGLGKYGGGIAMFAVSVGGLIAYFVLFGKRLRNRGQLKPTLAVVAASFVLSAAIALGIWFVKVHGF